MKYRSLCVALSAAAIVASEPDSVLAQDTDTVRIGIAVDGPWERNDAGIVTVPESAV